MFTKLCRLLAVLVAAAVFISGMFMTLALPKAAAATQIPVSTGIWGAVYSQGGYVMATETIDYHRRHQAGSIGYIVRSEAAWNHAANQLVPKAQQVGMRVSPVILPYTEAPTRQRCQATKYFGGNLNRAVTRLSRTAGVGDVVIDDFMANVTHYSRKSCKSISTQQFGAWDKQAKRYGKRVMPTLYPRDLNSKKAKTLKSLDAYRPKVVFAYNSLRDTRNLPKAVHGLHKRMPHAQVVIMVYAGPYRHQSANKKVVAIQLRQAMALDRKYRWVVGVWQYKPPLPKLK